MKLLTKSKFLIGLQCPKYLWFVINEPDKIPEISEAEQFKMDEGTKVGELAQSLFDGINCQTDDFQESLDLTKSSINNKPLFEPSFLVERLYARGDILTPNGDGWDIIEVKMGTKVKPENIQDVSFQKYVYEKAGLKIKKCFLMHLNKEFVKQGDIDPQQLFVKEDITEQLQDVEPTVKELLAIMDGPCPTQEIGKHCSAPYGCPIGCGDLPPGSVLELYRGCGKEFKLLEGQVVLLKDIPSDFKLTANQAIQRECALSGEAHIEKQKIKSFLDEWSYPLYYLDFETFSTAIPLFDGTRPYQQIPFQFSLHVVQKDGTMEHFEYLAQGKENPMSEFAAELKKVLGTSGSIVVYNQSFEINRIKELAKMFPEYEEWAEGVNARVVDLLIPFRNFWYYHPSQKGSASIKKVLPVLTGKSYSDLEIKDGGNASYEYFKCTHGVNGKLPPQEYCEKVMKNLLIYCGLDTEGMVWVVEGLRKLE